MAILSVSELSVYAPGVDLTGKRAIGQIISTQRLLEGYRGANRKLEITNYTKNYRLNLGSQTFRIQEYPLIEVTSLRARFANVRSNTGRYSGVGEWVEISDGQYSLDLNNGLVSLANGAISFYSGFGINPSSGGRGNRGRTSFTEVEAIFRAGFDFSEDSEDENVIALKASLGEMMEFKSNSPLFAGLKKINIQGDYSEEYAASSGSGGESIVGRIPDSYFEIAKQYRIRGNPTIRG